jgi:hypothetical protein
MAVEAATAEVAAEAQVELEAMALVRLQVLPVLDYQ